MSTVPQPEAPDPLDERLERQEVELRDWIERQMLRAGVGDYAARKLSLVRGLDYRRVVHLHELGMSDDLILNDYEE